jgi:hypothetical protein
VQPPFIIAIVKALLPPVLLLAAMVCGWAAPISPEEAKDHIGKDVRVRGLVEQVSFSKKGDAFLNFGGKYPQHVSPIGAVGEMHRLAQAKKANRLGVELQLPDKLGALKQLTAMMPDWTVSFPPNIRPLPG